MRASGLAIALVAQIAVVAATNSAECKVCMDAVNAVVAQAQQNETEEAVIDALDEACAYLTNSSQAGYCQEFADKVGPVLVSALSEVVNADNVCTWAGLC
ncbi:hypothetical protein BJY01DRAFT_256218 [Aspergillus pseudoustus]|uniref:Saposin B-type domain-containing protein n=1 Tax=Aspergillus pseudoustus TaxID=1810923 RepID=A0ABR4ID53_9EURO